MNLRNVIMCLMVSTLLVPTVQASEQGIERDCFNRVGKTYALITAGLIGIGMATLIYETKNGQVQSTSNNSIDGISQVMPQYDGECLKFVNHPDTVSKMNGIKLQPLSNNEGIMSSAHDCKSVLVINNKGKRKIIDVNSICSRIGSDSCDLNEIRLRLAVWRYCDYLYNVGNTVDSDLNFYLNRCVNPSRCPDMVYQNSTLKVHPDKRRALNRMNAVCTLQQPKNNKFSKGKR